MAYSLHQKKLYTCVKAKYPKARRTRGIVMCARMVYACRSNCIYAWVANKRIGEYAWRCGKDFGVCIRLKNTSLFSKSVVCFQKRFLKPPTRNSATRWRFYKKWVSVASVGIANQQKEFVSLNAMSLTDCKFTFTSQGNDSFSVSCALFLGNHGHSHTV